MRQTAFVVIGCLACSVSSKDEAVTFGPAGPSSMTATDDDGDGSDSGSAGADTGAESGDDAASEDDAPDPDTGGVATCGNGMVDAGEACDGTELGGTTCESLGFGPGQLTCAADCSAVDPSGCSMATTCGNGQIDIGEQCDGVNLGGTTCTGLGFDMGSVGCSATCTFDTSACSDVMCAAMFEDCTTMPCCAGLFCYPIDGNYCGPRP